MKPHEEQWKVNPLDGRSVVDARRGLMIADTRAPLHLNGREVSALIAAAPTMARALMAGLRTAEHGVLTTEVVNEMRDALRKAGVL